MDSRNTTGSTATRVCTAAKAHYDDLHTQLEKEIKALNSGKMPDHLEPAPDDPDEEGGEEDLGHDDDLDRDNPNFVDEL